MVKVNLGAKAKGYAFDVSDIDLSSFDEAGSSYSISKDGVKISTSKTDYVMLEGDFKFGPLMSGNYEKGIKHLDSITVVNNGRVIYTADDLDMTGKDAASGRVFKDFLATADYAIKGNAYGNVITGATHSDIVFGLNGNDVLNGAGGHDRLFGGEGNDHLNGGLDNDMLVGGSGTDTFIFASGDGRDTIIDFRATGRGHDVIDLSAHADVSSYDDLVITQAGSSVRVEVGDDTILLRHASTEHIDASDFLF